MKLGFSLVVIGLILSMGFTEIQRQMILNTTIQIEDHSISSMEIGLICMGVGAFLIIREYLKTPRVIQDVKQKEIVGG